jgi:hypothetical protein
MGYGLRYYIFPENDSFRPVPTARFDRFWDGSTKDGFPEYAGMKVKCAEALVEFENRMPVEIHRIATFFLQIREDGSLDQEPVKREVISALNSIGPRKVRNGNVIDASGIFHEKMHRDRYTWRISEGQVDKIIEHVFGLA